MRIIPRRLVVTGTVMADILLYLDGFPEQGGAAVASRAIVAAGAGYNLLAGATRLGLPAAYAGLVGSGPFGTVVRQALAGIAVPVLLAPRDDEDTGFDVGLVQASAPGQPTFIGWPGVESRLRLSDLRSLALTPGDAVYLSGYDLWYPEAGAALTEWISGLGRAYLLVFDPGPLAGQIEAARLDAAIGRADILSLNVSEAAMLTDGHDPAALAAALARRMAAQQDRGDLRVHAASVHPAPPHHCGGPDRGRRHPRRDPDRPARGWPGLPRGGSLGKHRRVAGCGTGRAKRRPHRERTGPGSGTS